jgi:hypothetical protein
MVPVMGRVTINGTQSQFSCKKSIPLDMWDVKVLNLVAVRVDNESAKVKGELADARKATDEAIRRLYDVLNALAFCILFLPVSRVECCFYHVTEARFKGGVSLLHIKSRPVDG